METKAVQILQARLEEEGGSAPVTSLSVKVKWGQHDLQGFGHIRKFLSKHHEVFSLEGSSVTLVKLPEHAQKTTSKSAPTAPPAPLSPDAQKRRLVADVGPNKATRINHETELSNGESREVVSKGALGKPAKPKAAMAPTPKTSIAPTPKGPPKTKDGSDGFAEAAVAQSLESGKEAAPLAPWHAQRALSRAAMVQSLQAIPRQDAAKPSWDEDTLSDDELRKSITSSKARGMELELEELAKQLVPTTEYRFACQRAVHFLKSAFSQEFLQTGTLSALSGQGTARMEMAGSAVQHTELDGSDLDVVCFSIPGSPDEREVKMARLWDKLHSPPHSNNLEATDATRLYPHATCQFSVRLRGSPQLVAHVIVDESASQESLDTLIRRLCDCCEVSRDVVRLVKFWATNHGLSGHEGYMNGVAWTAFVLCFLQRQEYVPPVAKLGDGRASWTKRKDGEMPSERNLTELLRGFFSFVCTPQPTTPRGMSLEGIDCTAAPPPSSHVGPPPPLYIEDPISAKEGVRRNLASTLGESQWARILEESRRIAYRLDPAKPQRWFYWAEVFDPQGLAGSGKRLPKLSEMSSSATGDAGTQAQASASGKIEPPIHQSSVTGKSKGFPGPGLEAAKGSQKGPVKGWPSSS